MADFKRAEELLPKKAIAQSDYDLAKDDRDEAAAAVKVAEAALNTAKLNLDFTRLRRHQRAHQPLPGHRGQPGPVGGQANVTLLTTIVSVDPMYAYFDVDERSAAVSAG